jgi:glutamate 5-kinase
MDNTPSRSALVQSRRIVVKVGSRVLVQRSGRPDVRRVASLVHDLAALRTSGREVVLVSSGAIACGLEAMGLRHRPEDLPTLQMAAAVGQNRLMALYDRLFADARCRIGQVLLSHADLENRQRHLNARHCLRKLLDHGVIPVVNENDAVATDEIKFGDNDALASRTAMLLEADLLVLLTTVDGFHAPGADGRDHTVRCLPCVDESALSHATGKGSPLSTGGMASKLGAAAEAAQTGTHVVIANGRKGGTLQKILSGRPVGTWLPAGSPNALNLRRRWVMFFHRPPRGILTVDDGARRAILGGKSLLAVGLRAVEGRFAPGDLVEVRDLLGNPVARGLASYSHIAVLAFRGLRTSEIREKFGAGIPDEIIHCDNLVLDPAALRGGAVPPSAPPATAPDKGT